MFKITYDISYTETKYICIHGQLVKSDDTLFGAYDYAFMIVNPGNRVTTCRQFLDEFDSLEDMQQAFPEQTIMLDL